MNTGDDLAQIIDPALGVPQCQAEQFLCLLRRGFQLLFGKLQMNEASDEPLLSAIVQVPGDALASGVRSGNQASSRRHQFLLRVLSLGDIANVNSEHWLCAAPCKRHGYLDGKLAPVGTHRRCLDPPVENGPLPGPRVAGETLLVCLTKGKRHDSVREFPTHHVSSPAVEDALEGAVD